MGNTLNKGINGEENEPQTELNAILKSIGNEVNHILQNQNKNLESIRQSLNEQTNYLKTIADNIIKPSMNFSQTKLGDIKNINVEGKAIQIINQYSNISVQSKQFLQQKQQIQRKQSPQQEQNNISEQNKLNKMNEMVSQLPQVYLKKRTEIYNRIQKIQLNLKNQLLKNDLITFKKKNSSQLQKIDILELLDNPDKKRGNIDYKNRFLVIPLTKYDNYQKLNMMDLWISDLYQQLSEEAFYGYLKKDMTKEYMKMFFSQNLILNTVKMVRFLRQKNQQIPVKQILKKFEKLSGPALEFQLKKYPQKKKIFIKPSISNMVQPCQIHQDPQYDMLRNMNICYQYKQDGIYYRQIKLMINKIINLTNQHFESYQTQMKKIFILKQQKMIPEYIQHQIGRKLNQNTPQFEEHQITSNKINIKSPQIMRIIIKWIEQLEDKIQKLQKNIDNRYYPFPLRDGGQVQYPKYKRQQISNSFKQYLINQNKFTKNLSMLQNIENQMINYIDKNSKNFNYISQNNIEVGLLTHLLQETVQEIAIKRLNQIIHSILSFQTQQYEFRKVNYITFNISDLLRSRCVGSYQNIRVIYNQLLKQNDTFKIIRVKNRLATGNRDFLINMRFKATPIICELQLGLILEKSGINQKQDLLGDFNHFLYELKRSKYGPLTQAVMLNAYYSQTITFFQEKLKKIKFNKEKNMKIQYINPQIYNGLIYIPDYDIVEQKIIFVCHNCLQVKYTKTCFLNTYKKINIQKQGQSQYLCGECVVNTLQYRNKYLLGDFLDQFFQEINCDQIVEYNQMLKYNMCYYLIISNNGRRYIVKRLDQDYFIQPFSYLVTQKYSFLKINQLDIKYVYRLAPQMTYQNNIFILFNNQQLNQIQYINLQLLIQNKTKWKYALCIRGKNGSWLCIDATREQSGKDYYSNLNLFIKTKLIKKFKQQKKQYLDLGLSGLDQKFFIQNLKKVIEIKKLNLSENNLTDISQIIEGKNIVELNLYRNKLVDVDLSSLINLQKLDLSSNQIENIKLDKLTKLRQLNLSENKIKELTLTNKQYQKLQLSDNQLTTIDTSKMQKLKTLQLYSNQIEKLVLENSQLQNLYISYNKIKNINTQKLVNLKILKIVRNQLQNLILTNSKLEYLDLSQNKLKSVNLKALVNLIQVDLTRNNLKQLQLNSPFLEMVFVRDNELQKIEISKLVNLKGFYATTNQLTQFPEGNFESLQNLQLSYNQLKKISLNGYPNLREVNLQKNDIPEFIVGNLPLQIINAKYNDIIKVDIIKLKKIRDINFSCNQIRQIVLENEWLQYIDLFENQIQNINIDKLRNLRRLNIRNNCIRHIYITKQNNPVLQYLELNNESHYGYFLKKKRLTKQEKAIYQQQYQKTHGYYKQILIKLGIQPIRVEEELSQIIESIKHQYNSQINIKDWGLGT